MKLVSFDIGIKNMAYCVFDITPAQHVHVIDWNVINLSTSASTPAENTATDAKCNCVMKKGAICGKKAQYAHDNKLFCGTHSKSQSTLLLPKKEYELSQIKKKKVGDVSTWYQSVLGPVPAGYKKDDMVSALAEYYRNHCFTKVVEPKKVNAKDINLVSVGRAIKHHFDLVATFSGADIVVVENQISTIATRMKTIQGMVAQYFIMREDTAGAQIEFVSSVNKLKGFATTQNDVPAMETLVDEDWEHSVEFNPQYKQHKTDGVRITRGFIDANPDLGKWATHFEQHKKRDDLADCFLQGVWYGSYNKLFCYADNLKINSV